MGRLPFPRPPKLRLIVPSNVGALRPRHSLPALQASVSDAAFSADSSLFALATGHEVLIYYSSSGALAGRLMVGPKQAYTLTFHPDNRHIAVGGHNGSSLTIWDVNSFALVQRVVMLLPGTPNWFQPASIAFSKSGATMMAQGQDERLVIWDWNGARPALRRILQWPGTFNGPLRASPDGYWLAAARGDGRAGLYRYNLDGELERQPGDFETGRQVQTLCFDGASRHLIYAGGASETGHAEMIRLEDGQAVRRFGMSAAEGGGQVLGATVSPAAPLLVLSQGSSLQVPGRLHIYRTDTGELLRSIDMTSDVLVFSPDGRRLLIASWHVPGAGSLVQLWTA